MLRLAIQTVLMMGLTLSLAFCKESKSPEASPAPAPSPAPTSICPGTDSDVFALGTGSGADGAKSIAIDSSGNMYVAGESYPGNVFSIIVRKSTDKGANWTTSVVSVGYSASYQMIAIDSADRIFVVGYDDGTSSWTVWRSTNSGGSWSIVDVFNFGNLNKSWPSSIAIDSLDNVYVTGSYDSVGASVSADYRYIVRKSANNGANWATVDGPVSVGINYTVNVNPYNDMLVSGGSLLTNLNARISTNAGGAWNSSDTVATSGAGGVFNSSIFLSASEFISVGVTYPNTVVARKTTDSGATWSTLISANSDVFNFKSYLATSGSVYTVGHLVGTFGIALVRSASDFSTTETVDTYDYGGGGVGRDIIQDSDGVIWVVGAGYGNATWIVRKYATCQ